MSAKSPRFDHPLTRSLWVRRPSCSFAARRSRKIRRTSRRYTSPRRDTPTRRRRRASYRRMTSNACRPPDRWIPRSTGEWIEDKNQPIKEVSEIMGVSRDPRSRRRRERERKSRDVTYLHLVEEHHQTHRDHEPVRRPGAV